MCSSFNLLEIMPLGGYNTVYNKNYYGKLMDRCFLQKKNPIRLNYYHATRPTKTFFVVFKNILIVLARCFFFAPLRDEGPTETRPACPIRPNALFIFGSLIFVIKDRSFGECGQMNDNFMAKIRRASGADRTRISKTQK